MRRILHQIFEYLFINITWRCRNAQRERRRVSEYEWNMMRSQPSRGTCMLLSFGVHCTCLKSSRGYSNGPNGKKNMLLCGARFLLVNNIWYFWVRNTRARLCVCMTRVDAIAQRWTEIVILERIEWPPALNTLVPLHSPSDIEGDGTSECLRRFFSTPKFHLN